MKTVRVLFALPLTLLAAGVALRAGAQSAGDNPGGDTAGESAATGAQVYRDICQGCHQPNAEGGTGAAAIPALAKNPHLADPDFVVTRLVKGKGGMPAFAGMLDAHQIAAVATHIRTHYGNDYKPPVTAAEVRKLTPESDAGS